jgi:hypothetical protein
MIYFWRDGLFCRKEKGERGKEKLKQLLRKRESVMG